MCCIIRFFIVALVALPGVSFGQTFSPDLRGVFVNPIGAEVQGLGTASVVFAEGHPEGSLIFTAAAEIHPSSQPFLLGKIEFHGSAIIPSQLTFQVSADIFHQDCRPETLQFDPKVVFTTIAEPGLREQLVSFQPGNSSTLHVDGLDYTLAFAGLSGSTQFDPTFGTSISSVVGGDSSSAYLFATLNPLPTISRSPPPECDTCHHPGVPEPATWLLAITGIAGSLLFRRFRPAASV